MTDRDRLLAAYDRSLTVATRSARSASGWQPRTAKRYTSEWARYDAAAFGLGLPRLSPIAELTPDHLALYAVHLGEADRAPQTINVAIAALKAWHRLHGLPVPDSTSALGVTREHHDSLVERGWEPRRARAVPLDDLVRLLGGLDRSRPGGRRDAAIIMLGYTMLTLDEMVGLDLADVARVPEGLRLRLTRRPGAPWLDVAHWSFADGPHHPALCPVETIHDAWCAELLALGADPAGPVLRAVDVDGRIAGIDPRRRARDSTDHRLRPSNVTAAFTRAVARAHLAGRGYVLGSLRIGGAGEARGAQASHAEVADRGGWSRRSTVVIEHLARWDAAMPAYGGRLTLPAGVAGSADPEGDDGVADTA